jgi:hypothetical protein
VSDLTTKEQANVRAALAFLKARYGVKPLAKVLRVDRTTLNAPASPTTAFRVARLAGVPVDDVLRGSYPPPDVCPHCGHRKEVAAAE